MNGTRLRLLSRPALLAIGLICWGKASSQMVYYDVQVSGVSNGSYSVSYVPDCGPLPAGMFCAFASLQEKYGSNGAWTHVSSGTGSATFSNRAAGTYYYRVHAAAYDTVYNVYQAYSPEVSVVISPSLAASRENILAQLDYEYAVRQGDINGDGRLDFLIARTSGGQPYNGAIEQLILQQNGTGGFSAVVPNSAQASYAASWPVSPVVPVLEDFNADGYADIALTGVSGVVAGADDQFVYAPGQAGSSAPKGVRAFDSRLARFVSNSMDYFVDQDYFINNAPTYYYENWYWYAYCDYSGYYDSSWHPLDFGLLYYWNYHSSLMPEVCFVDVYHQYGIYQDYSVFSSEALTLWNNDYMASSGYIDEQLALDEVRTDIEQLIGVGIGGWPMEEILGPVGVHQDPFVRAGLEIGRTILAQARGGRNRTTASLMPSQIERVPEHIFITAHPLSFARSRGHLALEFTRWHGASGLTQPHETISAGPDGASGPGGKLIASFDRPTDHPLLNFFVAEVEPQNMSDDMYWETYLKRRHLNYVALPDQQKVEYAFLPLPWSESYNSNSYISGITYDSPGNVQIELPSGMQFSFPGWSKPVPDHLFR